MDTTETIPNPALFRDELRVSLTPVLVFLMALAFCFILFTGDMNAIFQSNGLLLMRISLYLLIFLSWAAGRWRPSFGKYMLVISGAFYLCGFSINNAIPELFMLLFLPVGLAAAMLSARVGIGLAAALTAFFAVYFLSAPVPFAELPVLLALVGIWGMAGLMAAVYQPVFQIGDWVRAYYQRALLYLQEAGGYRIELNQALEELLHTNRQLTLANEKQLSFRILAEEAEKTKAAFVAKVSHEFRTPLNMIIGLVNLMIENPQIYGRSLPKAMLDDLLIIQRNCEHLTGMINDVLALSQAESGRLTLHRENMDLREIIEQALEVISPLVKNKGLETGYSIPDPLPQVYCDRTRIRQVLLNLVSNAARFTEHGGVYVQVEDQPTALLISVRDTGPGIAADDLERIFDPFCQGNNSQTWRDKGGTGLGLTISKQFIELHGGKIWVESQVGHGATFFFNLPKDQPVGPLVTPRRWISDRWTWIGREGKTRFSSEILQRPRIALFDPSHVLDKVLAAYKDQLEFSVWEDTQPLIEDVKNVPANLVLINANTQEELATMVDTIRQSIKDTPLVGCILPRPAWDDLSKSVARILVKPITKRQLNQTVDELNRPVKNILLIDNDTEITSLYTRMLTAEKPDIQITAAFNGRAALQQMKENPPDLVLLDISMPEMDGIAMLAEKDRDPLLCSIPVMIISAVDLQANPLQAKWILATMADGVGPTKLVDCALVFSELLLRPGLRLDQAPG